MGLKIRIPKHIWNAYQPDIHIHNGMKLVPKLSLKLRHPPAPPFLQNGVVNRRKRDSSRNHPKSCKARLFHFHYGGPYRQHKGRWQNEITYEQPCLRKTCQNCAKWHPHLVRVLVRSPVVKVVDNSSPAKNPPPRASHDIPLRTRYDIDLPNSRDKEHLSDTPACMTFSTQNGKSNFRNLIRKRESGKEEEV